MDCVDLSSRVCDDRDMQIDHVVTLVPDAGAAVERLLNEHGLGSEQGPYLPFAGTRGFNVPLEPPTYLEVLAIENRDAAEGSKSGRAALDRARAGYGIFAWAVLVGDLELVSERLGIEIFDFTLPQADGTLRGWRAIAGPPHLPFFIDYPNNGDRLGRWQAMYDRVGHTSAPSGFSELTISGSPSEMRDWLGPNDLPLRFIGGADGIHSARISTASGDVLIT
jgi:hypothetical protein